MKIILIDNINKLGSIGDVIEVKNGYAKNFLIPKNKAICYTDSSFKHFETKKSEYQKKNLNNLEIANNFKAKIEGKNIIIIENASDDGRLFGSVNSSVIANKINQLVNEKIVSRSEIFLKKPIKEIGLYSIKLNLHSDVVFDVKVVVSRSESEAEVILNPKPKNSAKSSKENTENGNDDSEEKPIKRPRKKKVESN